MLYVINFKCYKEGTGENALKLAKALEKVSKEERKKVILAVQPADIFRVSKEVTLPIFSQHIDNIGYGAYTGSILPESVRRAGARGTLLNHSEKRIPLNLLESYIRRAKEAKLKVIVCCENASEVKKIANFEVKPDFIAVEPKELIGGNVSVSKAKPDLIKKSVENAEDIPLLCGAGIKSREDVIIAKRLGAKGVLVASGIVRSRKPGDALRELFI